MISSGANDETPSHQRVAGDIPPSDEAVSQTRTEWSSPIRSGPRRPPTRLSPLADCHAVGVSHGTPPANTILGTFHIVSTLVHVRRSQGGTGIGDAAKMTRAVRMRKKHELDIAVKHDLRRSVVDQHGTDLRTRLQLCTSTGMLLGS